MATSLNPSNPLGATGQPGRTNPVGRESPANKSTGVADSVWKRFHHFVSKWHDMLQSWPTFGALLPSKKWVATQGSNQTNSAYTFSAGQDGSNAQQTLAPKNQTSSLLSPVSEADNQPKHASVQTPVLQNPAMLEALKKKSGWLSEIMPKGWAQRRHFEKNQKDTLKRIVDAAQTATNEEVLPEMRLKALEEVVGLVSQATRHETKKTADHFPGSRNEAEQAKAVSANAEQKEVGSAKAKQKEAELEKAKQKEAELEKAKQKEAELEKAKQKEAELEKAQQEQARKKHAELEKTKLAKAKVTEKKLKRIRREEEKIAKNSLRDLRDLEKWRDWCAQSDYLELVFEQDKEDSTRVFDEKGIQLGRFYPATARKDLQQRLQAIRSIEKEQASRKLSEKSLKFLAEWEQWCREKDEYVRKNPSNNPYRANQPGYEFPFKRHGVTLTRFYFYAPDLTLNVGQFDPPTVPVPLEEQSVGSGEKPKAISSKRPVDTLPALPVDILPAGSKADSTPISPVKSPREEAPSIEEKKPSVSAGEKSQSFPPRRLENVRREERLAAQTFFQGDYNQMQKWLAWCAECEEQQKTNPHEATYTFGDTGLKREYFSFTKRSQTEPTPLGTNPGRFPPNDRPLQIHSIHSRNEPS